MVDFLDQAGRSERMSRIRSKDTKPELLLRKALHRLGLRYRLGGAKLPGRPDLVCARYRAAIFVHGCFWHRHEGCKVASTPKSNTAYWLAKFAKNVERDARVKRELEQLRWTVLVAWECEVNSERKATRTACELHNMLTGHYPAAEAVR